MKIKKTFSNYYVNLLMVATILIVSCQKKETITPHNLQNNHSALNLKIQNTTSNYSGAEMFRGIFFMNGSFFNKIKAYKDVNIYVGLSQAQMTDAHALQDKIIDQMNMQNSTFFDEFKVELKSNSCTRIDKALDNAVVTFITAISTMPEFAEVVTMNAAEPIIHKNKTSAAPQSYNDLSADSILINNPELLNQNPLVNNQPQTSVAVALVAVVYVAAAVHNTVAVTGFVVAAGVAAVYAAAVLWVGKWCWSGALTVQNSDLPVGIRKLNGLKYEHFVKNLCDIRY